MRTSTRRSGGLLIRAIVVRPPECGEVPAEVQFEVAANAVTDITNLRTARLRTWQGQQWEEQVVARLKLGSCRRPEPIDLGRSPLFDKSLILVSSDDEPAPAAEAANQIQAPALDRLMNRA
jgi:hypothetical protein